MKLRSLLTYLASALVGLLIAEGLLRLTGARFSSSFYRTDADLGWSLRPNARGTSTEEALVEIQINSAGMRDNREYAKPKPPNTFRLAILGDSFAESFQVPLEESFPKLLEKSLAACRPGQQVEVLNFGTQGYGTAQELLIWRLHAKQYKPDAALLLFYTGNDLYNNHRALNPTNADAAPYFVLQNQTLTLQPALAQQSQLREAWATAARHSELARMITEIFYTARRQSTQSAEKANLARFGDRYMDRLIYAPPTHPEMQEAWAVTEAALPFVHKEITQQGTQFLLALAASSTQIHPDPAYRQEFLRQSGGTNLFYTEERLASLATQNKIPHLNLGPQMQSAAQATNTQFHGFPPNLGTGHWNQAGHRFVAKQLHSHFCPATP